MLFSHASPTSFGRFCSSLKTYAVNLLALGVAANVAAADTNRLAYLDHLDPYYVSTHFAKLTTPQWCGEPGVDCVVVLAIDDMRDTQRYENFLRLILDRLKKIDGRAPVSIMTNTVDLDDAKTKEQLTSWRREGLSIEIHTIDHPCPLLCDSDFAKAKSTYDRCVDLLANAPDNHPVAFRMPCCDSLNTPSPRFWNEIFESMTPNGNHLSIDSSVFCITNDKDPDLSHDLVFDSDGQPKFKKYVPFPSFVNTIQNYPYPYVIGRTCWEFPCVVPSDWEAQNLHQPNNPKTVADLKTALDVVVQKKGTFNLVFHPHGWIRSDQVVELIDHAATHYGSRVKFLTFRECDERLTKHLLGGHPLRSSTDESGKSVSNIRLIDIDDDGYQDVVRFDPENKQLHTRWWRPKANAWIEFTTLFRGQLPTFGVIDGSMATIAFVDDAKMKTLSFSPEEQTWRADVVNAPLNVSDNAITDLQLRDIDGDGHCEVFVALGDHTRILHRDGQSGRWSVANFSLPTGLTISSKTHDAVRFFDVDDDGDLDCLHSDAQSCSLHLFDSMTDGWSTKVFAETRADGEATLPPFVLADGSNNGVWVHSGHVWYQNENTDRMPDKVDRRKLSDLIGDDSAQNNASVFPPPRSPKAALDSFTTSDDVSIELVAAEPLINDPIAFDWDVDGSLWVVEMRDYPNGIDGKGKPGGRIKHLTDTDADGVFDQTTTFIEDLPWPTGVKVWRDGILITSAPNIVYAKDTTGDGTADETETLFTGFGEGNQQHRVNGLVWNMDGWLYVANGDSGGKIRSNRTGKDIAIGGRDLRINPDTGDVETVAGQTQFGRSVDAFGNWFGGSNSFPIWHFIRDEAYAKRNPHYAGPSMRRDIQAVPGASPVFPTSKLLPRFNDFDRANRFTSACSPEIYRDHLIGDPAANYFYVCEPVHNLVHREVMQPDGLSFHTERLPTETQSEV
ncbi:MAG: VCBS repeat-containing protein, partial [Planctomycetales bacterium]|nr:VCBS repeat-containing protein [Planctomycetales bacterium]